MHRIALHCTALHCTALHCTALHCAALVPPPSLYTLHTCALTLCSPAAGVVCSDIDGDGKVTKAELFQAFRSHPEIEQVLGHRWMQVFEAMVRPVL
jgi:hypothetical protein